MIYVMERDKILNRWVVWIVDRNGLIMDKSFKLKSECKKYIEKHSKKIMK